MPKKENALNSLYGKGHINATRTRECVAMPGTRNQTVLTPQSVVDGLNSLWPMGVNYDPCFPSDSEDSYLVNANFHTKTRGLIDPWPDRTYANPPYGKSLFDPENQMEDLLLEEKIRAEAKEAGKTAKFPKGLPLKKAGLWDWLKMQLENSEGESVLLCPNRTNRKWLRAWRSKVDGLVELDPLAFLGEKQAFPAPLVLGFKGPKKRVKDFWEAFKHLGDPVK